MIRFQILVALLTASPLAAAPPPEENVTVRKDLAVVFVEGAERSPLVLCIPRPELGAVVCFPPPAYSPPTEL